MMLVKGLTINMINFSQVCNENLFVKFTKDKCIVLDQNQCQIMEGNRSSNNYYLLTNTNLYMNVIQNYQSAWYQQLGHASNNKHMTYHWTDIPKPTKFENRTWSDELDQPTKGTHYIILH